MLRVRDLASKSGQPGWGLRGASSRSNAGELGCMVGATRRQTPACAPSWGSAPPRTAASESTARPLVGLAADAQDRPAGHRISARGERWCSASDRWRKTSPCRLGDLARRGGLLGGQSPTLPGFSPASSANARAAVTRSGGERKMVSIARALRDGAQVLLVDEQTEGLVAVVGPAILDGGEHRASGHACSYRPNRDINPRARDHDRRYVIERGRDYICGPPEEAATNTAGREIVGAARRPRRLKRGGGGALAWRRCRPCESVA